ncbi:MAG: hypothetical protein ABIZ04_10875 [Opitutus sp.]
MAGLLFRFAVIATVLSSGRAETATEKPRDPIAEAKKDYAAIKASESPANRSVPSHVAPSVPALELPSDTPPPLSPIQRARKTESMQDAKRQGQPGASKNWLVDALQLDGAEVQREQKDGGLVTSAEEKKSKDTLNSASSKLRAADGPRAAREKLLDAPNPLRPFLSQWMTPKDLALLQPKPAGANAAVAQSKDSPTFFSPSAQAGSHNGFTPVEDSFAQHPSPTVERNPYLSDPRETALSVFGDRPLATPPVSNSSMPTLNAVPPPITPIRPAEPPPPLTETFKPQVDARDFKQLKRF